MKNIIFLVLIIIFSSCNRSGSKIENAIKLMNYAENNYMHFDEEDWISFDENMTEFFEFIDDNRNDFSDNELSQVSEMKGQYLALLVKHGYSEFSHRIRDIEKQLEGFIKQFENY